jgi:cysteine sulfinate desulfinase/cysteine desulfurase-like protein
VRFSLGAGNIPQQVDDFLRALKVVVSRLRSLTAMAV